VLLSLQAVKGVELGWFSRRGDTRIALHDEIAYDETGRRFIRPLQQSGGTEADDTGEPLRVRRSGCKPLST